MRSVSDSLRNEPVRTEFVGFGDQAIFGTVGKMERIVKESARNPYVRKWAERIIEGIAPNDKVGEAKAIYEYVRDATRYTRDPRGIEYLQTPQHALTLLEYGEEPNLDCDDSSMLATALLSSVGFDTGVRIASYHKDRKFEHVYGVVGLNGKWVSVDAVRRDRPMGWEARGATRLWQKEFKV